MSMASRIRTVRQTRFEGLHYVRNNFLISPMNVLFQVLLNSVHFNLSIDHGTCLAVNAIRIALF